ncbi:beta-alanine n-methyltransferase related protein [Corchorus capsularis]|uniref:Beta-alanine n-methyltransferase related protein n=1 Tax=Corchorus capsularis TaxID=210143 RepID=A0A1R3INP0_COCAP|nr:beta-alanine n-methyltransferase related protein [Corchorus capsularis]
MENCYKALPVGGKLIACEPVLPKESDDSHYLSLKVQLVVS